MHLFLKFIFGIELYMFQTGFLSIIRTWWRENLSKTFYSKNKFEKLVYLIGFIIRTYDHTFTSFHCRYARKGYYMKINLTLNVSVIFDNETNTYMNNMFCIRRVYCFLRCVRSDDYMGLSKIQVEK
jgi:hypothetical protein